MKLSPAKLVLAVAAALFAVAMLAPTAGAATPAPGYEQFAGCPSKAENSKVVACIHAVVNEGHFQMGTKDVPIENPIQMSGGTEAFLQGFLANSKGGLTPVKQKVPGGVIGLTGLTFLLELLGSEALTLYAVTEAAGLPEVGFNNIMLPIRVHLVNGVLGSKCYVGSFTNPITLHLTTGTTNPPAPNKPITGKEPVFGGNEKLEIAQLTGGVYVDNSFAAPGASGCVLTLFGFIPISINGLVNTQSGLPSAAGHNETIQQIDSEFTAVEHVYP